MPTAITIRPQLASSPAIAVFTSGELATTIAIFLADFPDAAPVTSMRTSFCAPSPSRITCNARSSSSPFSARAKSARILPPSAGTRLCLVCPVAISSTVSEVDVSLSTVVQLNVSATPFFSRDCRTGAGILASVKMKHSIVAMSGAIMPLPLAMPVMRTSASPIVAVRVDALGKVSVVMMPRAAASQLSSRRLPCSAGNAAISFSCGRISPITPVEATITCLAEQSPNFAAAAAVAAQASCPALPVNTFAFPAFTTTIRALPPFSADRHQSTGAPGHLLLVKTPAAVLPGETSIITRSVRPW